MTRGCEKADVTIYVTPGNHDHWETLLGAPLEARDEIGPCHWITDRIAALPRGHRFTVGGRSFISLGGASSIDRDLRKKGVTWWPDEMITEEDVDRVAAGGHAEIMLLHDSPARPWCTDAVACIYESPSRWPQAVLYYCATGRARVTRAVEAVRPRVVFHGHYHVLDDTVREIPGVRHPVHVYSLPQEYQRGNLAILDTDDLTVTTVG